MRRTPPLARTAWSRDDGPLALRAHPSGARDRTPGRFGVGERFSLRLEDMTSRSSSNEGVVHEPRIQRGRRTLPLSRPAASGIVGVASLSSSLPATIIGTCPMPVPRCRATGSRWTCDGSCRRWSGRRSAGRAWEVAGFYHRSALSVNTVEKLAPRLAGTLLGQFDQTDALVSC